MVIPSPNAVLKRSPLETVCYQANLSLDPLRNIVGINKHLGTALVAMAALVIAMHLTNMTFATREYFVRKSQIVQRRESTWLR
ncbi:hypothetical protein HBH64_233840 [Parastagonospora nodorum]|nr:hypothetical protein HBH47_230420 [Parastagonospora nodorum]KAH4181693.1 hypothetical protein HBH42_233110 [Parastagonospora nodorum]KAH4285249.1 hypothetical protein HBI02_233330 [Parastagonospora nodorum]KAH4286192.1 hypothetical protein HBI01_241190 [Parastagonospora nodorum]KAH4319874.1 hypothetical protein HBI00_236100 [Parastagonospora nodorum]